MANVRNRVFWRRFGEIGISQHKLQTSYRNNSEMNQESEKPPSECPICCKAFPTDAIEAHVNRCIFLNSTSENESEKPKENKRTFSVFSTTNRSPTVESKKFKKSVSFPKRIPAIATAVEISDDDSNGDEDGLAVPSTSVGGAKKSSSTATTTTKRSGKSVPLAERMRPETIDDYIGQSHVMGKNTILRKILDKNETPSMILWGPPGVGKVHSIRESRNKNDTENEYFFVFADNAGQYHRQSVQDDAKCSIRKAVGDNGRCQRCQTGGGRGKKRTKVQSKDNFVHGRNSSLQ